MSDMVGTVSPQKPRRLQRFRNESRFALFGAEQTMPEGSKLSWREWWHETRPGATQFRCRGHEEPSSHTADCCTTRHRLLSYFSIPENVYYLASWLTLVPCFENWHVFTVWSHAHNEYPVSSPVTTRLRDKFPSNCVSFKFSRDASHQYPLFSGQAFRDPSRTDFCGQQYMHSCEIILTELHGA